MTKAYLTKIRDCALLLLLQVLIFNRIHLFGYATVYIYLLFILKLPRFTSRNELLLWGFLMGLTTDTFGNTPGMNAAAATALAFVRNYILEGFVQKGTTDDFIPGTHNMPRAAYIGYIAICLVAFCIVLYLAELFTVDYPLTLLAGVAGSTLLTVLFAAAAEIFTRR